MTDQKLTMNYHTHTPRCFHAYGTEREYIETAIEGGITTLGFADHTPYPFPIGYRSKIRMQMSTLRDYVDVLSRLKEEYKSDIIIHIGLEVEYYPRHFDELMRYISLFPIEYIIMGQHHLNNEYDGEYVGAETTDEDIVDRYISQVLEGLSTGKFLYIAHPDLLHYVGDDRIYEEKMRYLIREIKKKDVPLEINLQGLALGRNYPDKRFWKIAGEEGADVIIGSDAHWPHMLFPEGMVEKAYGLVNEYGLKIAEQPLELGDRLKRS